MWRRHWGLFVGSTTVRDHIQGRELVGPGPNVSPVNHLSPGQPCDLLDWDQFGSLLFKHIGGKAIAFADFVKKRPVCLEIKLAAGRGEELVGGPSVNILTRIHFGSLIGLAWLPRGLVTFCSGILTIVHLPLILNPTFTHSLN